MARTSRFLAPLMVLALLLSAVAAVLPAQQVFAANEVWDIALNFTTNPANGSQAMTIGTVIGGSADPLVAGAPDNDSPAPPRPAASVASAWLRTPGSNTAIIDRRDVLGPNAGNSVSWSVILSASDGTGTETTMTLAWPAISGVANFPLDATITLTGFGSAINMRTQTSVQVTKGNYTAVITVTRLGAPSTVWVDDDWCEPAEPGAVAGDIVGNGYIYGYNAFCDIQQGVDAVTSPGTVNVLHGSYSAFNVTEDDTKVIGQDGAAINTIGGFLWSNSLGGNYLAGVFADNVLLQNLEFSGVVFPSITMEVGVYCENTSGTVLDRLTIYNIQPTAATDGYGIYVKKFIGNSTVSIVNPAISGCVTGIYVEGDTVNVSGGYIQGRGYSSSSTGIWASYDSSVTVSGTRIYDHHDVGADSEEPGVNGFSPEGVGVYCDYASTVEIVGCCKIHDNDVGIFTYGSALLSTDEPGPALYSYLVANGNNIYDNVYWGVFNAAGLPLPPVSPEPGLFDPYLIVPVDCENNWWGHEEGPTLGGLVVIITAPETPLPLDFKGDRVSFGVDYTPWLDGPCPSGDPVGMSAKFKGVARSGEPGLKVQFTDLSTPAPGCEIEEWLWNFGDGSTSTEQNPFHVYNREGAFNVTLTVWDSCGFEQTITMKAYITIKKPSKQDTVEPAKLGVSYLNIDPAQVLPNQEVTISANICNSGEERGTKTVSLMVNGEAVASQSVGVSGGSCQQVVFKTSRAVPGTYQVAIDGMTGEFSVLAPRTVTRDVPSQQQTGLGTAGIIAIIAVIVVLIAALIMVFKRD